MNARAFGPVPVVHIDPSAIPGAAPADARAEHGTVELLHAADLKPEPIRWLWPGWLARGKLHVLAGAPGTGKTTLALDVAACVTAGRALPSGWRPKIGSVIVWSGEDDAGDTIVPRLLAAGADLARVRIVGEVLQDGQRCAFDPERDVQKLAADCAGIDNIALLIVDPLVSAVSGDSHRNAEVRRGLAPLVDLAARLDAALIGVTHFSKGTQGRDPLERVSGSLAFGALARVVLGTIREQSEDPTAPRSLVVARAKSNIGPDGDGFRYAFEQVELPKHAGVTASRIAWGAALSGPASSLLSEPDKPEAAHHDAADACSFLRELLADEPMGAKDVRKAADDAGYSWRTMQRAMKKAGVISKRQGVRLPALWSIPGHTLAPVAPVAPTPECGATGATGAKVAQLESGEVRL